MTHARHTMGPRRLAALLAALVALVGIALPATAAPAAPGKPSTAAYDTALSAEECGLLGREFVKGSGCSRRHCEDGATPFRKVYGAEACALRGQPKGYGFVATVDVDTCRALNRRWLADVNYCASLPDRSLIAIRPAAQCEGSAPVYVVLEETEGYYDECLTQQRAAQLTMLAVATSTTLSEQVALHSSVQCAARPEHRFLDGTCVEDPTVPLRPGGTLLIGDSLSWRGSDELGRVAPKIEVDAEPARPATELAGRLEQYRKTRTEPSGLIIELGTVPAPSFSKQDLLAAVRSVPRSTKVMLVLPHFELASGTVTPQSRKVGGWMKAIARSRGKSCVADWPAYVRAHAGILQDGVHVVHRAEGAWARWLAGQWKKC